VRFIPQILSKEKINANAISLTRRVSLLKTEPITNEELTKIKKHLKEFLNEKPRENNNLRLSSIGKPDRQLWYNFNSKKEMKDISPSTRIKFLYGYILEELLLTCAAISGHKVEYEQKEVELSGVIGHQDAVIDDVVVDCKSSSGASFSKF